MGIKKAKTKKIEQIQLSELIEKRIVAMDSYYKVAEVTEVLKSRTPRPITIEGIAELLKKEASGIGN